jgi:hypothetical protein
MSEGDVMTGLITDASSEGELKGIASVIRLLKRFAYMELNSRR